VIEIPDFQRVDMRVGRILTAEELPEARKPSYRLTIDFGRLGIRRSVAALRADYEAAALAGRQVVCVFNLPPRRVAGIESDVLVLAAVETSGALRLLEPVPDAELGSAIA
jgi:tRNA-binding protein